MGNLSPIPSGPRRAGPARPAPGFTLIELLVVMVIMGITLGLASLSVMPGRQQSLHGEAERIALLLQMARDEAIVRNRQVAFEAGPDGYRFLVRDDSRWQPITSDDLLRERAFKHGPLLLTVEPSPGAGTAPPPLSIIFGREPVDKPFLLTLADADRRVAIRADGIGHFTVE